MLINLTTQSNISGSPVTKQQLVNGLRQKIQSATAIGRATDENAFSSGCDAIDQLLPAGGYSRGTIVQWFNPPSHNQLNSLTNGYGIEWLSLMAAKNACPDGQALVIIDPDHTFNPPAAAAIGIELSRLIILRPPTLCHDHQNNDLLWAIDQALRCSAVGAVWGMVGDTDPRWLRRFQLSAEQSGVVGFFVRPGRCASDPSWAEIDWQAGTLGNTQHERASQSFQNSTSQSTFWINLRLLRAPHGHAGRRLTLQVNTITGSVQEARVDHAASPLPMVTQLAHPTLDRRATTT